MARQRFFRSFRAVTTLFAIIGTHKNKRATPTIFHSHAIFPKRFHTPRLMGAAIIAFLYWQFGTLSPSTIVLAQAGPSRADVTVIPLDECNTLVDLYNSTNGY